jgi:hypothetical protein
MEEIMKKILILIIAILSFFALIACASTDAEEMQYSIFVDTSMSVFYLTFEQALMFATDVVIAQYIGHRPFRESLIEVEFRVVDRIFGNAADTIFVYLSNPHSSGRRESPFNPGTNYLLPLSALRGAMRRTHDDGYLLIRDLVINLDNPTLSQMYRESVSLHGVSLDFDSASLTAAQIISFVEQKTMNNTPARPFIRSENIEDIILGSPYVLVVEVNEPRRLVSAQGTRDWMEIDIFYVSVIDVLKGDVEVGAELPVGFFAYTVQTGQRHIVAIERIAERSVFFRFSSRNSLFRMDQLEEIMAILGIYRENEQDDDGIYDG